MIDSSDKDTTVLTVAVANNLVVGSELKRMLGTSL
jgi:hypothetical protein